MERKLTIEQKAEAYDKALQVLHKYDGAHIMFTQDLKEEMFPELKESEDEKWIPKEIIKYLKEKGDFRSCWIAWLEKQGETFTKKDVDDAYLRGVTDTKNEVEKQYEANYQIRKDIATFILNYRRDIKDRAKWIDYLGIKVSFVEKQGEQKPADKVEPKFKIGDWIIDNNIKTPFLITGIFNEKYDVISIYGTDMAFSFREVEHYYHLWTIQDAKDGDVLVIPKTNVTYESILIFNKLENNRIIQHLHYFTTDAGEKVCEARSIDGVLGFVGTNVHPATKEQRDTLMKAMADAGWEFDFDKKKLKKIVVPIEWSEEDEANFNEALSYIKDSALKEFIKSFKPKSSEKIIKK